MFSYQFPQKFTELNKSSSFGRKHVHCMNVINRFSLFFFSFLLLFFFPIKFLKSDGDNLKFNIKKCLPSSLINQQTKIVKCLRALFKGILFLICKIRCDSMKNNNALAKKKYKKKILIKTLKPTENMLFVSA